MKVNYWWLSLFCLLLSLPLAWGVLHRATAADAVPVVRVASFNAALNRAEPGALLAELRSGSEQAKKIAEIVQRADIDVLLLCELDRDTAGESAKLLAENYFNVSQRGARPIDFAWRYVPEVNTGEPSGRDLDGDGRKDGPGDAQGFGSFSGQYGMALFSRHPIETASIRTFRMLPWSAMPGALRPPEFWSDEAWGAVRLSSKSHCDVSIRVLDRDVHLLLSHPTPPVFDGREDRNGRRNHDEIRFWVDYLTPGKSDYIVDDQGKRGGLPEGADFVVLGDLNCDPVDGDAQRGALTQLLAHPRVSDPQPKSAGAIAAATQQWGANSAQKGDPALDTGDFDDVIGSGPGNLRTDYVLPSRSLRVMDAEVFWPSPVDPRATLVEASDHRLVWVDVAAPAK